MVGQTVSHYRIVERLAQGGMAVVYKAEDLRLRRLVALKFLPSELTLDPDAKERLIHEARTASALDHPNIGVIHEFDETSDGQVFIAMAYYEGQTLRQRIATGPLPIDDAIRFALEIASAAAGAHEAGVVHRDIKPANVIVTPRSTAKLLDFGIAKLSGQTRLTRTGTTLGTIAYMSPEQIAGVEADSRSDVWAIGVVLFEMLTGRLPFDGSNEIALINSIVNSQPRAVGELRPDVPTSVEQVISRTLAKDPASRFADAKELTAALATVQREFAAPAVVDVGSSAPTRRRRAALGVTVAVLLALCAPAAFWFLRGRTVANAREHLMPEIRQLIADDRYVEALSLVRRAQQVLRDPPELATIWNEVSVSRDVQTTPPGARVSVRDTALRTDWQTLGETPLKAVRVPRGALRWKIERTGFSTLEFVLPSGLLPPEIVLDKEGSVPAGMVRIPAGPLALTLSGYASTRSIPTGPYLIDRTEVSNRQFKEFVDAGGYQRREFWKHSFNKDGRRLEWTEARAMFTDQTGRPGPATWEVGTYPRGQDHHPVAGVSWYEAAAYAEYVGKALPTIYHWARAAGTPLAAQITPTSNFRTAGSLPVGTTTALGPFGLQDMAGNVKEWCLNELPAGDQRYVLGGAWNEPDYMFIYADARPAFDRPVNTGFRLVQYATPKIPAEAFVPIVRQQRNYDEEKVPSDEVFQAYKSIYAYDDTPLDARVERVDEGSDRWRHEKVSFNAAYGNDRVPAHLFLPKTGTPPFSVVIHWPGSGTIRQRSSDQMTASNVDFLVMSGRAVLVPVYYGSFERNDGRQDSWPELTRSYRDWVVKQVQDARRALDYVATRPDLRSDAMAYFGLSWGARMASVVIALEPRLEAAVLVSGGLSPGMAPPEVDAFTFAPRVSVPVLMINGDSDFIYMVDQSQKPLFRFLGTPLEHKRHLALQGGHAILNEKRNRVIRETLQWFDRYVGTK
jgi:dienelactone hydrolase